MKTYIRTFALSILIAFAPACAGLSSALGLDGTPLEESEARIEAIENAARGPADAIIPVIGGSAVLALGWAARQYVRRRAAKAST